MSLDTEKLHRLRQKRFNDLYDEHSDKWNEMVSNATDFAHTYLGGEDRVRPADISAILHNAVKVDRDFETHLQNRGLQQKYWAVWFADYCVERVYPPPEIPRKEESSDA